MAYFSKFPVVNYPAGLADNNVRFVYVRNLLRRIALSETIRRSSSAFYEYDIKDGERPEHIAERVYGSPTFHWLVLIVNGIVDPYTDWYKSESVLDQYNSKRYQGYAIYFSKLDKTLFHDSSVFSGSTLAQSGKTAPILSYNPAYCRLHVKPIGFSEGAATIQTNTATHTVEIHRVDQYLKTVNEIRIPMPSGATQGLGAKDYRVADPLSQYSANYSNIGTSISSVPLHETHIGVYMGLSGEKNNAFVFSNFDYEIERNNKKRTIKILHPRYTRQAITELESLLGT